MKKEFEWFDKPENIWKLKVYGLLTLLVTVAAELMGTGDSTHQWDKIPGFYAMFGFISCVVLIVLSKFLGKWWLKKGEEYYDE
ncbi:MAG: hypothetical protein JXD19_04965 [Deltaproteobacteria bacterium]|nr:hypothetical protein [Deltaproteobacteria bacterium]